MLLALRINVLSKGHSGISVTNLQKMIRAFNHGCLPLVPAKGTVGASGDLSSRRCRVAPRPRADG